MIVDLPGTTTNDINKKITGLTEEGGAITLSRVLTLVISLDSDDLLEESIEAANFASREHPCRVIVVVPGDRSSGRGAYTCRRLSCFERAAARHAFNRTLRQTVEIEPALSGLYT